MDDLNEAPVPDSGVQPTSPSQTQTPSSTPPPTTPPETKQDTPSYLTKEEAAALWREQLESFVPEFRSNIEQDFALKKDIAPAAQSAADKTYAKYMREMKKIAPKLQAYDEAVANQLMSQEQADIAKQQLLSKATAVLSEEEPEPTNTPVPQQQVPTMPDFNQEVLRRIAESNQRAAAQLLKESKLSWDDVRAEMDAYRKAQGKNMELPEFTVLVATKKAGKAKEEEKTQWMKEYEAKVGKVITSDKNGATIPPPDGNQAAYKPKPTLEDAGDIGDVLEEFSRKGRV